MFAFVFRVLISMLLLLNNINNLSYFYEEKLYSNEQKDSFQKQERR